MGQQTTNNEIQFVERSRFFRDHDGARSTAKARDSVLTYQDDFSDKLASGESFTSVEVKDDEVTVASINASGTTLTMTIGECGDLRVLLTTDSARVLDVLYRFKRID